MHEVECRGKQVPVDIVVAVSRRYWDVSERTLYAIRLEMGNQCRDRRTVTMLHRIRSGHNTRSSILGLLKINVNHCSSPGLTFRSALLGIGIAVTGGSGWKPQNADTRCV